MDKKSIIAVAVLGVLLVGIIITAFIYDGAINTTVLEVNGVKYDITDFESYLKVWQYENGTEPVDVNQMYTNYSSYKAYSQLFDKYKAVLPDENKVQELTDEEYATLLKDYDLTQSEYMRVKTEIANGDYVFANLQDYIKISDEEYNNHKVGQEDLFKTYDYRVMQIAVEQPSEDEDTSGDTVSGDVSTEVSGEISNVSGEVSGDVSGEKSDEQIRKDEAMSKAVLALARVKSGDSFETVAGEYGQNRLVFSPDGSINFVNGNLETISGYYMDSYLNSNIANALKELEVGEYSEIMESDTGDYYSFVYLADVRDGLEGKDDAAFRKEIAMSHVQQEVSIIPYTITLGRIKLNKLIPVLNVDNSNDEISGEVISGEGISGEIVSGDGNFNENVSGETNITSGEELNGN